jgi:hypothetical protein
MALSETSIANMSLARIGAARINTIDDTSVSGQACRDLYAQTRDSLLRDWTWNFAIARADLAECADPPEFGWRRQFQLPSDFLRLVFLNRPDERSTGTEPFAIEGSKLLTNAHHAHLVYVSRVTDPTKFDSLFTNLLVLQLALALCMPLTQDKAMRQQIAQETASASMEARDVTAGEKRAHVPQTWLESRMRFIR